MKNVNADIDRMRDFVTDLKRHKEAINIKNRDIILKLKNLNSYWKDKAYESFKESFIKELSILNKKNEEFIDIKMKEIEDRARDLEDFLNKMNRR